MNPIAPTAHHPLGPSQWPAWSECSAFDSESSDTDVDDIDATLVAIEEGDIAEPDDDDEEEEAKPDKTPAGRGRLQHAAMAAILGRQSDQAIDAALAPLSHRETEDVMWCVEKTREIVAMHGWDAEGLRVEQRVTMLDPSFRVMYFGTEDATHEHAPLDFDFKFGFQRNYFPQLCGYTLPKLEHAGGGRRFGYLIYGRLRQSTEHVIDLPTAQTVAYGILRKRQAEIRPPKPCQYCGMCAHKLTCAAINQLVTAVSATREDWPIEALRLDQGHISLMRTDPVMLGKARRLAKSYLEKWCESVNFATRVMAENGIAPLGYKRVEKKGSKKVTGVIAAVNALEAAGVPRAALEAALKASFGALVTAFYENQGGTKKAAEAEVERILREAKALTVGPSGFMLRAENDCELMLAAASAKRVQEVEG
jgi:hypothetical protein